MRKKIFDKTKEHIQRVIRLEASPHSIAAGFGTGTAIALFPTFGLGVFIGLALMIVFKKISKISMLASFAVWNPIVLLPMYTLSYKVGDFLISKFPNQSFKLEVMSEVYIYSTKFIIGNIAVVAFFTITSYFIILYFTSKYQEQYQKYIDEKVEKSFKLKFKSRSYIETV